MKIDNEELKFKIYNVLSKNYQEEITEEELKKVKTISINKKDANAQDILFKLKDFEILKYIECLTLNMFDINDELIEQIELMKNLNFLVCQYFLIMS